MRHSLGKAGVDMTENPAVRWLRRLWQLGPGRPGRLPTLAERIYLAPF